MRKFIAELRKTRWSVLLWILITAILFFTVPTIVTLVAWVLGGILVVFSVPSNPQHRFKRSLKLATIMAMSSFGTIALIVGKIAHKAIKWLG
jgi:hypothetical protein